jgi:hypothetical protein
MGVLIVSIFILIVALIGLLVIACLKASKKADEEYERWVNKFEEEAN